MRRLFSAAAALALASTLVACGSDDSSGGDGATTLTVFAAASLTSTFTELGEQFEADHDGVKVVFDFAGSSDLVAQIQQGAPADVFASADTANMDKATGDGLVEGDPVDFATNVLEIATPPDNPADVTSLQDLAKPGVSVVVCAPEVPCGAATVKVTDLAGVKLEPVSEEQSVTDVLGKVTSGDADAGLVYVTDVTAAGDAVHGVEFPESDQVVNVYPIAALADSKEPDLAADFVKLVTGEQGQSVLSDAGFGAP
ncbi:MAG: molybdate ABC transporter substrate-binding protein [Nocardioides sp.]|uniref:molybdate ABC transporter substrate-binding protein n=1 Tax=Nocardioides sp. TaxID=35761 RepID=UPI0039E4CBB7